ncbi:MAG: 4Fe-4S dicluster domain-containing protein [Coriobacteriales bacterium]|jgi:carbon-monoxide dehydrogenase iron sulfur subunit
MTQAIIKKKRKLGKWERGRVVVLDQSICSGCRACETVCSLSHFGVANPGLSAIRVERRVLQGGPSSIFLCAQCESAPCERACPKKAISEDPKTHAKVVDEQACIGCGICEKVCIISPSRISVRERNKKAFKCDLCGGDPQCVAICPMGALAYEGVAE